MDSGPRAALARSISNASFHGRATTQPTPDDPMRVVPSSDSGAGSPLVGSRCCWRRDPVGVPRP
jgi:hypothetical protein